MDSYVSIYSLLQRLQATANLHLKTIHIFMEPQPLKLVLQNLPFLIINHNDVDKIYFAISSYLHIVFLSDVMLPCCALVGINRTTSVSSDGLGIHTQRCWRQGLKCYISYAQQTLLICRVRLIFGYASPQPQSLNVYPCNILHLGWSTPCIK